MNLPPYPPGPLVKADYDPKAFPAGKPQVCTGCIPLHHAIALYWQEWGANTYVIQRLIHLKTLLASREKWPIKVPGCAAGPIISCLEKDRENIHKLMVYVSDNPDHPWPTDAANVGRFIASGLTRPEHLALIVHLTDEEFIKIPSLAQYFPPNHPARQRDSAIIQGAHEALLANRDAFSERAKAEDEAWLPHLDMQPALSTVNQLISTGEQLLVLVEKEVSDN